MGIENDLSAVEQLLISAFRATNEKFNGEINDDLTDDDILEAFVEKGVIHDFSKENCRTMIFESGLYEVKLFDKETDEIERLYYVLWDKKYFEHILESLDGILNENQIFAGIKRFGDAFVLDFV